jgi:hypothetical protein
MVIDKHSKGVILYIRISRSNSSNTTSYTTYNQTNSTKENKMNTYMNKEEEQKRWNVMTEEQKLWYFGGLIDGEGYIGMSTHGGGLRPIVQLQMTCEDTVKRFADHFGMKLRLLTSPSRVEKAHWKPLYHTRVECQKSLPVLKALQNKVFLKKEALDEALRYYQGRSCLVCGEEIPDTRNAASKYCCPECQKKAKKGINKKPLV